MRFSRRLIFFVLALVAPLPASVSASTELRKSANTEVELNTKGPSDAEHAASGTEARNEVALPVLMPLPLELLYVDKVCHVAYVDTFNILRDDNSCSRFFGGSAGSLDVLNKLALQMQKERLSDRGVGIRMWGQFTYVRNFTTGFTYRLFDNAMVNTVGPFYSHVPFGVTPIQNKYVGRFPAHTREARVLMLLHELGHLIQGSNGSWLIPDDYNNFEQNMRNTIAIEARCNKQIRSLG